MKIHPLPNAAHSPKLNVYQTSADAKIIRFPNPETPTNEPPPSAPVASLGNSQSKIYRLEMPELQQTENWMSLNQNAWIWFQRLPPDIKVALYEQAWRTFQEGNLKAAFPGSAWNKIFLQAQRIARLLAA